MIKKHLAPLLLASVCLFLVGCHRQSDSDAPHLINMHIVDRNGFSETIGSKERLNSYKNTNFLSSQPYQKVLRVYSKNIEGKSSATLTMYHPNGLISEYLDIVDGRAHGTYRKWYPNGTLNIDLTVLDGSADLSDLAKKSWLFDGKATISDDQGNLLSEIFYSKGILDSPSLYYHPNGTLQKRSPYRHGLLHGEEFEYAQDGTILVKRLYNNGILEGPSVGYWPNGALQFEEEYLHDRLLTAVYYNLAQELVSSIDAGHGFQAHFDPKDGALLSLHEFADGKPEGIVKEYNKKGVLTHSYCVKEGMKDGEEWRYYAPKTPDETPIPKMMVTWHEDMLQGVVKTWYPSGVQESSREMHQNSKQGFSFAWYVDGSLMLSEEYNKDSLMSGTYYQMGNGEPVSSVIKGSGTATLFDKEGKSSKKVPYEAGKPLLAHD